MLLLFEFYQTLEKSVGKGISKHMKGIILPLGVILSGTNISRIVRGGPKGRGEGGHMQKRNGY